jgi:uncharacterized membrane protein
MTSVHAVSWDRGQLRDLGVLPPAPNEDWSQSFARAVNDNGTIVGASGGFEAGPNDGYAFSSAFVYDRTMRFLTPPKSDSRGVFVNEGQEAFGINNAGVGVGVDGGPFHGAVVWAVGREIALRPVSSFREAYGSEATAINRDGWIVGAGIRGDDSRPFQIVVHPLLWRHQANEEAVDLGVTGGFRDGLALAINDRDEIVGFLTDGKGGPSNARQESLGNSNPFDYSFSEAGRAALWRNGAIYLLPQVGASSVAHAINDRGAIVGISGDRAVLWRDLSTVIDLNTLIPRKLGWMLRNASGINNAGWIVGWGTLRGVMHAFLLKPI